MALDLTRIVDELRASRQAWRDAQHRPKDWGARELPSREILSQIVNDLRGALFPMRLGPPDLHQEAEDFYVGHTLDKALSSLITQVHLELRFQYRLERNQPADLREADDAGLLQRSHLIVKEFGLGLPGIRLLLDSDVLAAFHGDPAARSVDEVLLCYPGVHAMIYHRLAHLLHQLGVPLLARLVSELAHGETGIDIHPGATIGPGCFIDHGTGVVIGETAHIGKQVRLYQAVTLGAKRFSSDENGHLEKGGARHPIVEDDVVIYAGATILGRITIGKGSTIGGNVWLTHSVPPYSRIAQTRADGLPSGNPAV